MPPIIAARPAEGDYNPYFGRYIGLVPTGNLVQVAEDQIHTLHAILGPLSEEQSRSRYAPDKWSVREVVGHLTDVERVFAYRATSISRADPARLPGYDQAEWLPMGGYDERTLPDLLHEFACTRRSTVALMRAMPAAAIERRGIASDCEVTVLALLTIPVGHLRYHLQLLERDYGIGPGTH